MQNYQKLEFWKRSHELTLNVYKLTNDFPKHELFGLVSQMRRSTSSIPTNIAEGCGRDSKKELKRFLYISFGSSSELEYQLLLAKDLGYINEEAYNYNLNDLTIIRKQMNTYIHKIKDSI